jgi:hypothetical protein
VGQRLSGEARHGGRSPVSLSVRGGVPVLTAAPPVTAPGTTVLSFTADRRLDEQIVVTETLQGEEPERFVRIDIFRPDGLPHGLDRRRGAVGDDR